MSPAELDARLAAAEQRVPAPEAFPTAWRARGRRRGPARPLLVGVALALVLGGGAVSAGPVIEGLQAQGHPGVQNPGQPLHGARLECMSPPEAERFLARRGFRDVVWQVESGPERGGRSVQQATAPEHGYVIPGALIKGTLYMVVDQREGATGTGACPAMRMP